MSYLQYKICFVAFAGESESYGAVVHNKTKPSIIIVGAGVSGLAAATRLIDNGFSDIKILEAENRIGGRVKSVKLGNWTVDCGAHWVHGQAENPVYELAEPLGLLKESGDSQNKSITMFSDGKQVISELANSVTSILENGTSILHSNESLKAVLIKIGEPILRKQLDSNDRTKAYLSWVSNVMCTAEGCDSLDDVSGNGSLSYRPAKGSQSIGWKGKGYGSIIELLLRRHEKSTGPRINLDRMLHLNSEVKKISITDNGVSVECNDGTTHTSDIAIVTVSLGVLKNIYKTLFYPNLPDKKINAIKGLGIGTVDKVILKFSSIWWPNNCSALETVWLEKDKIPNKNQFPWEMEVLLFATEDGSPYTLTSWLVGEAARSMESNSIDEVKEGHMRVLKKFFGHKFTIPEPVEVIRTKWGTNPHFRGSYSYRSIASDRMNASAADLAQPLKTKAGKEVVFFAGEATHSRFYSTVHGALDSGWREADRIIKLFN